MPTYSVIINKVDNDWIDITTEKIVGWNSEAVLETRF